MVIDPVELADEVFQLGDIAKQSEFKRHFTWEHKPPTNVAVMTFIDVLNGLCKGGYVGYSIDNQGKTHFTARVL